MAELVIVATLTAKPGRRDELLAALEEELVPTHAEEGVTRFSIHAVRGEPDQLLVIEAYRTEADLERHYATPHFAAVKEALPHLLAEPSRVVRCEPIPLGNGKGVVG